MQNSSVSARKLAAYKKDGLNETGQLPGQLSFIEELGETPPK